MLIAVFSAPMWLTYPKVNVLLIISVWEVCILSGGGKSSKTDVVLMFGEVLAIV